MILDSAAPKQPVASYMGNELRFLALTKANPEHAAELAKRAQAAVEERFAGYQHLAAAKAAPAKDTPPPAKPTA